MLIGPYIIIFVVILTEISEQTRTKKRNRRYLVFTKESQYGVYVALSIPLVSEPFVSLSWFFEASYYGVDNSTWFEPLLGDISTVSRNRKDRSIKRLDDIVTRKSFYIFIESMLEKHGYPGRACLLRAICENADAHFLHNGLLGDLLYFVLTPSTSISEEDIDDSFYEAEYNGLEKNCGQYFSDCPSNALEFISIYAEDYY